MMPNADRAIAHHDPLAATWDARYRSGAFQRRAQFFADRVLPRIETAGRWLDFGCGSGFYARLLAARGAQVTGVDGSAAMIEAAERASAEAGAAGIVFLHNPPDAPLPFGPVTFDGCLCLSVVEYLPDPAAQLAAFAEVLRPGGTAVVSFANRKAPVRAGQMAVRRLAKPLGRDAFDYLDISVSAFSAREIREAFTSVGCEVAYLDAFDPVLPPAVTALAGGSLIYAIARKVR